MKLWRKVLLLGIFCNIIQYLESSDRSSINLPPGRLILTLYLHCNTYGSTCIKMRMQETFIPVLFLSPVEADHLQIGFEVWRHLHIPYV